MAIDPLAFRAALGRFATGVTVVTVAEPDAPPTDGSAITMSAFLSLSLHPPLVGVAIDHEARAYGAFVRADRFCVSILAAGQERISDHFAARPASLDGDPFVPFHDLAAVDGALAHIACRVVQRIEVGDHDLVVGEVEHARVRDGAPLIYFRSVYRSLE